MSLSLVPAYDSATSSSDSEGEPERRAPAPVPVPVPAAQPSQAAGARELGTMLSRILPPPKGAAPAASARPAGAQKVQVVVDLPKLSGAPPEAATRAAPTTASGARQSTGGSLSSELFAMLPAPKNSGRPAATSSPQQAPAQADRPLIPHSLANKRRAKAKPSGQHGTTQPSAATGADRPARATDAGSGSEDVQTDPTGGAPFFTIGEAAASEIERPGETAGVADAEETGAPDINDTHTNMVYDPTSGYYYDTGSGAYYFYDTERGEFVDARAHYSGSMQDSDEPAAPTVGSADLEKLLRRGELGAAAGAAIATVSQAAQLAAGGYSDARAAADYSARRTAEQQRQTTRRRIDGDEIGKQKKHKHNIMYLALQAQEQEASLNEAHARHKATKKAARARYGL